MLRIRHCLGATLVIAACGGGMDPSPAGSVVKRLGPSGGFLAANGGRFTLSVPAGALPEAVDLEIDSVSAPGDSQALAHTLFVLGPPTVTFAKPATATIRYDGGLDPARESSVGMYVDSSGAWWVLPGSTADFASRLVSAPVTGAGRLALLALGPVATVTVIPNSVTVVLGTTQQLSCKLQDSLGNDVVNRPVTWASQDTTVIQVDQLGRVYPISIGTTLVTATSSNASGAAGVSAAFVCSCPGRSSPVTSSAGACACGGQ